MGTVTILGDTYQTVIMPDGKKWTSQNLEVDAFEGRWYENNETLYRRWGRLYYNLYRDTIKENLPTGWRIPTRKDWIGLIQSVGFPGELDTIYTTGALSDVLNWYAEYAGRATNTTGFSAKGSGRYRNGNGFFGLLGGFYGMSDDGPTDRYFPIPCFRISEANRVYYEVQGLGYPYNGSIGLDWMVSIRLVCDSPDLNLYVNHASEWAKISEQSQIDGGAWKQSSKIFVPSSGAWAQS